MGGREMRGGGGRDLAHPKILAWRPYDGVSGAVGCLYCIQSYSSSMTWRRLHWLS